MSTVIITNTHIGCDHMVVSQTIPNRTYVDTNHMKIFVHPDKTFLYALSGNFDPTDMQSDDMLTFMKNLVKAGVASRDKDDDKCYSLIKDDDLVEQFKTKLPEDNELIVATATHRFTLLYIEKFKCLALQTLGDVYGIGTGGPTAIGLIRGGLTIKSIWEPLNDIVNTSSVAHTIIDLDILEGEVI